MDKLAIAGELTPANNNIANNFFIDLHTMMYNYIGSAFSTRMFGVYHFH